jgi:hypothetical protein
MKNARHNYVSHDDQEEKKKSKVHNNLPPLGDVYLIIPDTSLTLPLVHAESMLSE